MGDSLSSAEQNTKMHFETECAFMEKRVHFEEPWDFMNKVPVTDATVFAGRSYYAFFLPQK